MSLTKDFKINNFDLLRLAAATEVIVDHYFQHLNINISAFSQKLVYLFPGVPAFFVISGYLISASFERNNNLKIYFRNRALRIYPGLWVVILVTILALSVIGISFLNRQTLLWTPLQMLGCIYTPHFLEHFGFGSYNGSLWTLPIELQFYILLPLCYFLLPKRNFNGWLIATLILFIALKFCYETIFFERLNQFELKLVRYSFVPHFYLFLTGVVLQRLKLYQSICIFNKGVYWAIGYVFFNLVISNYLNVTIFEVLSNLLFAITILSLAYTLPWLSLKVLKKNDISYGIYIYHGLILGVIVQEKWTSNINLFIVIIFAVLFGYLSWILVERPFIKLKERTIRPITS